MKRVSKAKLVITATALVAALLWPAAPALAAPAGAGSALSWLTVNVHELLGWALGGWGEAPDGRWADKAGAGMDPLGESSAGSGDEGAGMDPDGSLGEKVGPGMNPDGSPTSSSGLACGEAGAGMDPNGHCGS